MKRDTVDGHEALVRDLISQVSVRLDDHGRDSTSSLDFHYSKTHSPRAFKAVMGEPIGEYIRRLRLERAAKLLASTQQEIGAVALDAGYESSEGFGRAFRCQFGCTPTDFRSLNSGRDLSFPTVQPEKGFDYGPCETAEVPVLCGHGQITTFVFQGVRLIGRMGPPGQGVQHGAARNPMTYMNSVMARNNALHEIKEEQND